MSEISKVERPKLAGAFSGGGVPDRSSGLSGLLPPSAPRTQPEVSSPAESTPQRSEQQQPRKLGKKVAREETAADMSTKNVGVYLEPELLDSLKRAKRTAEVSKTYDDILFDALAKVGEEDLAAHFEPEVADYSSSLLPRRNRRPRGAAGIQVQLRLDADQRDVLDELTTRVGAPSRSALVAAAFQLALLGE